MACCSNGEKLEPLVILDRPYRGLPVEGLQLYHNKSAWMTSDLMFEWLHLNSSNLHNRHLLLDCVSGHKTTQVQERMEGVCEGYTLIPAGQTSTLQPLDIGVNKPFKDRLRSKWG